MDVKGMARAERLEFADFLAELPAERWNERSLCTEWTVRQVVTHVLSYEELGFGGLAGRVVKARFSLAGANTAGVTADADRSPEELVALLRKHAEPRGLTASFGGRIALLDGMVHQQDIRRPLGMPRTVPPDRLRTALSFARIAPPVGAFWRARGLRLVATDVDWTAGRGPELRGPGEAVLLAIAGRAPALSDVDGPGRAILGERIG